MTISWLTASTFLFGALAIDPGAGFWAIYLFLPLAFFGNLAREIVKDVQDIDSDIGYRTTLPMRIGTLRSCQAASYVLALAVLISPLPFFEYGFSIWYLIVVFVADAAFVYAAIKSYTAPSKSSQMLKLAMFIALFAFIVGALGGQP